MKVLTNIRILCLPGGRRKLIKNFVTLERKYGYFWCRCPRRSRWESSHVYCVKNTKKVFFRQRCRKCRNACNPYWVEKLMCSQCRKDPCTCMCMRHIDMKKTHREDLCVKCERGYPCVVKCTRTY